jgi:hypothetical protein
LQLPLPLPLLQLHCSKSLLLLPLLLLACWLALLLSLRSIGPAFIWAVFCMNGILILAVRHNILLLLLLLPLLLCCCTASSALPLPPLPAHLLLPAFATGRELPLLPSLLVTCT